MSRALSANAGEDNYTIFRADASLDAGVGHVMRCLTLAEVVKKRGGRSLFLCRPQEGDLITQIADRGHRVLSLPRRSEMAASKPGQATLSHSHWLGTDQTTDAEDCLAALAIESIAKPAWLVADHYGLDAIWERRMNGVCNKLMVLDDLADRQHVCDLLLDQNLGRRADDYEKLVPKGTRVLAGPSYALLRPEFAEWRAKSLSRRSRPMLRRLLITLGGVDRDNITLEVLEALDRTAMLPYDFEILVVMGPCAPWLDAVRSRAKTVSRVVRVLAGVSDMACLMAESDLAIGGAGATAWERCCLGLPTIQLVLAANQMAGAAALEAAGAAVTATSATDAVTQLSDWIIQDRIDKILGPISDAAARITSGDGANIVVAEMERLLV